MIVQQLKVTSCFTKKLSLIFFTISKDFSIHAETSIRCEATASITVKKKVLMNVLTFYRDRAVRISRPNSVRFLLVALDEEQSLQEKGGYIGRIVRSHFGCWRRDKQAWRSSSGGNTIFAHGLQSAFDCDCEIFEHLLWTLINLSHLTRNKSVIETLKLKLKLTGAISLYYLITYLLHGAESFLRS